MASQITEDEDHIMVEDLRGIFVPTFPAESGIFTERKSSFIRRITLRDIIRQTTSIEKGDIQENVFFWHTDEKFIQSQQCSGYLLIQKRKKMGMLFEPGSNLRKKPDHHEQNGDLITMEQQNYSLPAIEWLNEAFCRSVTVELNSTLAQLRVLKRRIGGALRKLDFKEVHAIGVTVTRKSARSRALHTAGMHVRGCLKSSHRNGIEGSEKWHCNGIFAMIYCV
uniref:DDE_Tnp_1_7 domain-containing protein n=1 Tax=Globodera pallida TaxID=36090 RepID=A0A183CH41_GLOPA